jgi:hypothetical protein
MEVQPLRPAPKAGFPGKKPDQEGPDPVPFQQEEDEDEQRQDESGGKVPGRAAEGQRPADDAAGVVLQGRGCFLQVLVHLGGGQVQRPVGQPVLDLLDPGQRLRPEFAEA